MSLLSHLGLDVIREPVDVVAREDFTARHGGEAAGGPHLLDVVVVVGVNNGRDVEVSLSLPATELDLAEHARDVLVTLLDGVVVANVVVGEVNSGLLLVADSHRVDFRGARAGSEVDGANLVVEGPEGDLASGDRGSSGSESQKSGGELHLERSGFL